MRCRHELAQVRIRSEMRIDTREIGDPVSVITGRLLARSALHRFVLEDRAEPDGRDAKDPQIIEAPLHAAQIAAVIEALCRGIESTLEAVARKAAPIIRRIAVVEAVGQQKIDDFVFGQPLAKRLRARNRACLEQRPESDASDRELHADPPGPTRRRPFRIRSMSRKQTPGRPGGQRGRTVPCARTCIWRPGSRHGHRSHNLGRATPPTHSR